MTATITFTAAQLADKIDTPSGVCTCHRVSEGADGLSYSYAMLGVVCASCDADEFESQRNDWWNNLTREERIAELTADAEAEAAVAAKRAAESNPWDSAWEFTY